MPNRLADAISPYLRAHAGNPVDWWPWGPDAFAAAAERDVPVLVSIGYATCHWCHVMARESFSDPGLAEELNERFVAIKVDREELPDVDAAYLAAASAFTPNLGWPLTAFATSAGRVFFAGTYYPPQPRGGQPSLRQILDAVTDAWVRRRDEVEQTAASVGEVIASAATAMGLGDMGGGGMAGGDTGGGGADVPSAAQLDAAAEALAAHEDSEYGGFGTAPKFPVAPALGFLLSRGAASAALARRTIERMAASPLRDPVDGGFFRYATQRDWSRPHYERMLYDNAQLLRLCADASLAGADADGDSDGDSGRGATARMLPIAGGIARFLLTTMRLPSGGFASAQDSESTVGGERSEGGYYALAATDRLAETPPALDEKVLTGWNGLVLSALARAGFVFDEPDWIEAAVQEADWLLATHTALSVPSPGVEAGTAAALVRASIGGRVSSAPATLEDYGMLAGGLLDITQATGEVRFALAARELVDAALEAGATSATTRRSATTRTAATAPTAASAPPAPPFAAPGGGEPTLAAQGLAVAGDPSEGAYPSGLSAMAAASQRLFLVTADDRYRAAARAGVAAVAGTALANPLGFGRMLELASALERPAEQLVVVLGDGEGLPHATTADRAADAAASTALIARARRRAQPALVAVVTEGQAAALADAGFELFAGRPSPHAIATAYLCRDFVCRLPVTTADALADAESGAAPETEPEAPG